MDLSLELCAHPVTQPLRTPLCSLAMMQTAADESRLTNLITT